MSGGEAYGCENLATKNCNGHVYVCKVAEGWQETNLIFCVMFSFNFKLATA